MYFGRLRLLSQTAIGTAVSIIFDRERQDAPVHALAAEAWQGTEKVLKVEPMHCMGLTPAQVVVEGEKIVKFEGKRTD